MSQLPSLCDNDTKPETTAAGGVRPSRQTRTTRRERQELSVIHALTQTQREVAHLKEVSYCGAQNLRNLRDS